MVKKTLVTLMAAASIAGIAAPAFANGLVGDGSTEMREFLAEMTQTELQQRGVNTDYVDEWNGMIRAFVTLPDGTQTMQFFDSATLQQVHP